MADDILNDNDNDGTSVGAPPNQPDAHGHAAMLLVESLIHGLIARSVISVAEAVEIVEVAVEVKTEIAVDRGDSPAELEKALAILGAISASLQLDMPER